MTMIATLNTKNFEEAVIAFSKLAENFGFQIESIDSLVKQWIDDNITVESIDGKRIHISWNRSYHVDSRFDDYINNGEIFCDITEKNLWAIVNGDEQMLEGDWEYRHQYHECKHGDSSKATYHYASIGGVRHTHKSELVCSYGTRVRKYPSTLLPLLKGVIEGETEYSKLVYGDNAKHYHRITNYDEIPTWIPNSNEWSWFEG
jgi:hypothetical protein